MSVKREPIQEDGEDLSFSLGNMLYMAHYDYGMICNHELSYILNHLSDISLENLVSGSDSKERISNLSTQLLVPNRSEFFLKNAHASATCLGRRTERDGQSSIWRGPEQPRPESERTLSIITENRQFV